MSDAKHTPEDYATGFMCGLEDRGFTIDPNLEEAIREDVIDLVMNLDDRTPEDDPIRALGLAVLDALAKLGLTTQALLDNETVYRGTTLCPTLSSDVVYAAAAARREETA